MQASWAPPPLSFMPLKRSDEAPEIINISFLVGKTSKIPIDAGVCVLFIGSAVKVG
jgi:hypothetical protein